MGTELHAVKTQADKGSTRRGTVRSVSKEEKEKVEKIKESEPRTRMNGGGMRQSVWGKPIAGGAGGDGNKPQGTPPALAEGDPAFYYMWG